MTLFMQKNGVIFIALAIVLIMGCTQKPEEELDVTGVELPYAADFTQPLDAPWEWIHEDPKTHKVTEEGLKIKIEPGGLMGGAKVAKNILVRPLPQETQSVTVNVNAQHETQYEQAGLILYVNGDNYIKLLLEFVDGEFNAVMVPEVNAKDKVYAKPIDSPPITLEFRFESGKVVGSYQTNEASGTVGAFDFPMEPRPMIGVFTQSGEAGADRWATFRNFVMK